MKTILYIAFFCFIPSIVLSEGYWMKFDTTQFAQDIIRIDVNGDSNAVIVGSHTEVYGNGIMDFWIESYISISTNRGETWTKIFASRSDSVPNQHCDFFDLLRVKFVDSNTIRAIGYKNNNHFPYYTFTTTNRGATWDIKTIHDTSGTDISVTSYSLNESGDGVIASAYGLYRIEDNGKSIINISTFPSPENSMLTAIRPNRNVIYAISGELTPDKLLHKTTDMGVNWTTTELPPYTNFMEFINDSVGYFIQQPLDQYLDPLPGVLYKTTDGGANLFKVLEYPSINWYQGIKFIDQQNGYIAGGDNFFSTTNGGQTWEIDTTISDTQEFHSLGTLAANNSSNMFFVQFMLSLWKYYPGKYTSAEEERYSNPELLLASPNPFTDVARVNFVVEQAGRVSVVVRNSMGEQVATREYFSQSGEQNFSLSGANLPAGIYFCDITASGKTYRAKAVLVR